MHDIILEKDKASCDLGLAAIMPKIEPLLRPSALIFYVDFTLSVLVGNALLWLASGQEAWSLIQIAYTIAAALALFRATVFMHEISHAAKKLKGFEKLFYRVVIH
mgnify:CR=1 FL=1